MAYSTRCLCYSEDGGGPDSWRCCCLPWKYPRYPVLLQRDNVGEIFKFLGISVSDYVWILLQGKDTCVGERPCPLFSSLGVCLSFSVLTGISSFAVVNTIAKNALVLITAWSARGLIPERNLATSRSITSLNHWAVLTGSRVYKMSFLQ